MSVRRAGPADAEAIGRLLHDFNTEYDDITPGPQRLAERIRRLLAGGETAVLLAGADRTGSPYCASALRSGRKGSSATCAELYVAPDQRGRGLGRALMEAALDLARTEGADHMDLGTGEDDTAARALYESLGFSNREGRPDGPINYSRARAVSSYG